MAFVDEEVYEGGWVFYDHVLVHVAAHRAVCTPGQPPASHLPVLRAKGTRSLDMVSGEDGERLVLISNQISSIDPFGDHKRRNRGWPFGESCSCLCLVTG